MPFVLTIPLAVEKTLYRLALREKGVVSLARLFLELPLSLQEVEEYADKIADGHSVMKNEWGEHLCYEFPELQRQMVPAPDDCPVCGGDAPPVPTEGGVPVRRSLLCNVCFAQLRKLHRKEPDDPGMVEKMKSWFTGDDDQDFVRVARTEHEIFHLGLNLGVEQFTHTTLAMQSRLPSSQIKERLDWMAQRRYIQVGLLPTGDAVAYSFPKGLDYPQTHYRRLTDDGTKTAKFNIEIEAEDAPPADEVLGGPVPRAKPAIRPVIKPKKPPLQIRIKSRRTRPE